MGRGIITRNGASPLVEWRTRLTWIGSDELSADVRRLLSGLPVVSEDGVLELSFFDDENSALHRLIARRPSAPYSVDIYLRALQPTDLVLVAQESRDNRDPMPSPTKWSKETSESQREFELFNCVLHSLSTRKNGQ